MAARLCSGLFERMGRWDLWQTKISACLSQSAFIPVSDEIIKRHLRGYVASSIAAIRDGAYPLLKDDTCWFLALISTRAVGDRCACLPDVRVT